MTNQLNPAAIKEQTPSVGRIVHYVAYGTPGGEYPQGKHRAAIITQVTRRTEPSSEAGWLWQVALCVLNPTGMFFHEDVPLDNDTHRPGTWHWPEYVP